ncbi:MAG: TIGR02117 family protein [Flavobacteriales bacterium]
MQQKKRKLYWYQKRRVRRATKRTVKASGYVLTFLGSAILLYVLSAFLLSRISVEGKTKKNARIEIYLMKSGVHTDFVVPVKNDIKDWRTEFPLANTAFKDSLSTLLSIGWGDQNFYMNTPEWSDLTLKTAVTVPFGIGPSAIHATYYQQLLNDRPIIQLRLTTQQYKKLVRYIENALVRTKSGWQTVYIKATKPGVVTGNDAYYAAYGRYNLFSTCNTWVNNGLKACQQKACYWTAFAGGIFYQYGK